MADVEADLVLPTTSGDSTYTNPIAPFATDIVETQVVVTYTMRARDANANDLTYRAWKATIPDFSGVFYTGAFSGVSRNFVDVAVTNLVADDEL